MKIGKGAQVRIFLSSLVEGVVKKWRGRKTVRHKSDKAHLLNGQGTEFKKLGKGYWGSVSQFFTGNEGPLKVVKKIDIKNYSDKEVKILERLGGHEHCVSLEKQWWDDKYHYIGMEDAGLDIGRLVYRKHGAVGVYKKANPFVGLFRRGDGFRAIDEVKSEKLFFKSLLFQSLQGLGHMHEKQIVHRDIKPSNIMITPVGQVRVGDFGCATEVDQTTRFRGDIRYQPPETSRFRRGSYTEKSDIWMLGATMTEMLLGKSAIMGFFRIFPRSIQSIFRRIDKAEGAGLISRDTGELLKSMLAANPADRPSAQELLHHEYFQNDLEKLNQLKKAWGKD